MALGAPEVEELRQLMREKRKKNPEKRRKTKELGKGPVEIALAIADLLEAEAEQGWSNNSVFFQVEEGNVCSEELIDKLYVGDFDWEIPDEESINKGTEERRLKKVSNKFQRIMDDLPDREREFKLPQGATINKGEYASTLAGAKIMWKASKVDAYSPL